MHSPLIFLLCTVVICWQYGVLTKPPKVEIRKGEDAKDGEFPYMVQIRTADRCFYCGGSIIAPKWILTAGHCIDEGHVGESGNYTIVYGTKWLCDCLTDDDDPDTVIKVKTLHRHPKFDISTLSGLPSYDVGLLELEEEIPFDDLAKPISLAESSKDAPAGELGNLTGWGTSTVNDYPIVNLQKIKLRILDNKNCSSIIDNVQNEDFIHFNGTQFLCTNDNDNGQCNGDSGGPYAINGTQYGIVSWSIKPCGLYPGVYSRVALPEHRQWIKNISGV